MDFSFDTPQRQNFLKNAITHQENDIFLGRGSFGCVFKAVYKGKKVAVKVISKHDEFKFSSLKREKNIRKLFHPNLIRIWKVVETKETGAMIMERFTNSKSLQYILDHSKRKLDLVQRLKILRDVGNGLKFCHENNIIHRDLKPDNIMIVGRTNGFICKIFDFGCSCVYGEKEEENGGGSSNMMGTIRYSAPELLQGREPSFPIDIFSIGIVMWQLMENEIPYQSIKSNDIILWQVVKNNLRPDSTLLLLAEVNEMHSRFNQKLRTPNSSHYCKSDLMCNEFLLQAPLKQSMTPVSIVSKANGNCNNCSRSDCKRDKLRDVQKPANSPNLRSIRKITRKNLFDCQSIDLLMNIEGEDKKENASTDNLLTLFQNDYHHHCSSHEKFFQIENEYIKLYKACWHKNADKRPRIEDFCSSLTKFIDCLQL